jgi:putative ABC transport system ATP-binding protein
VISIKALTKVFRARSGAEVRALDGIDLEIKSGEFAALTGPSGSGKTTLLFTIGGLVRPSSGSVSVGGVEVSALSAPARAGWRAKSLGFVFQTFYLVPYLSAVENVCLARLAIGEGGAAARKSAEEILARLGLAERVDHLPGELSAGEQQRVSLARALANEPAVLLADEPTGNLDGPRADEIMNLLAEENKRGQTIVLATHSEPVAARASRRIRLDRGKLVG